MALNPTKKDLDAFLVPKVRKFVLTNAQLLAGSVTAIANVIPAKPRYILVPMRLYLMHPAGTAYAVASRLNLQYAGGGTVMLSADVGAGSGFLDSATLQRLYVTAPSTTTPAILQQVSLTAASGLSIEGKLSGAVTTGTFAVYGLVEYRELPHSLIQA